jgi:hypothetical protein
MNWKEAIVATPFSWRDWENHEEPSFRVAGVLADIRTKHLQNADLEPLGDFGLNTGSVELFHVKSGGKYNNQCAL